MKQRREMIQHLLGRGFQVDPDTLEDILTAKIDLDTFLTFVEQVQPEIVVISKSLLLRFQASLSETIIQTTPVEVENEKIEEADEVIHDTYYYGDPEVQIVFEKEGMYIATETLSFELRMGEAPENAYTGDFDIDGLKLRLGLIKVEQ